MADINIKGTFLLTQACVPHLRESANPHVLTIAPPLNMNPRWLGAHPVYTLSKYGMSLLSLGWAAEFADAGIAFNCLWPQTYIATVRSRELPRRPDAAGSRPAARRSWPTPPWRYSGAAGSGRRPDSASSTRTCWSAPAATISRSYGGGTQPIQSISSSDEVKGS